jgi:hypothetical protein
VQEEERRRREGGEEEERRRRRRLLYCVLDIIKYLISAVSAVSAVSSPRRHFNGEASVRYSDQPDEGRDSQP